MTAPTRSSRPFGWEIPPIATLRPNGASVSIFYVHSDALNTPRQVTRPSDNTAIWTWNSNPFGTDAANPNPAGAGSFTYNLRFPGQYFEAETGLHYNGFRNYDPAIGGYAQSDLLGLAGGSLSTYAYTNGNPISRVVIEQALARAGLAEAARLGPEDPLADVAAAIAIVGTIVLASDPPASPAASTASGSCRPKERERARFMMAGCASFQSK